MALTFAPVKRILGSGFKFLGTTLLAGATGLSRFGKVMFSFGKVFAFLFRAVGHYAKFWAVAFTVSRIWEKAKNLGERIDVTNLGKNADVIAKSSIILGQSLVNLKAPFTWFTDKIANFISPLFSTSFYVDLLAKGLGKLYGVELKNTAEAITFLDEKFRKFGDTLITFVAGFSAILTKVMPYLAGFLGMTSGAVAGPIGMITGGALGFYGGHTMKSAIEQKYGAEGTRLFDLWHKIDQDIRSSRDEKAKKDHVPESVTNIGKVEIRNQFAENFDPDRVAVTIIEGLNKASNNKLGSLNNNPMKTVGLTQRIR